MVVDRFPPSPARNRPTNQPSRIPRPSARRTSRSGEPTATGAPRTPSRIHARPNAAADPSRRVVRTSTDVGIPNRPSAMPTARRHSGADAAVRPPRTHSTATPRAATTTKLRTPARDRPDPARLPSKSPRVLPDRGTTNLAAPVTPSPARAPLQASPYARRTSSGAARATVNRKLNMGDPSPRRVSGASSAVRGSVTKPRAANTFKVDRRDGISGAVGSATAMGVRRESLSSTMDTIAARRESLKARRESLAARREAAMKARRDSLPDRRDPVPDRTDGASGAGAGASAGAGAATASARRDNITARRESLTARREALAARREGLAARRDSLTARRQSITARRESLNARRESLNARRDSLTARRESLTTRRESNGGRRISSGNSRAQNGMTALESFRAARRASLQAEEDEKQNENENVLDGEKKMPISPPTQKGGANGAFADRPSECVAFPDRLDPIVPTGSAFTPARRERRVSDRFNDANINLEDVKRLRASLGGRRSIGPNDEMPEEVPQLRRHSLESYNEDGTLRTAEEYAAYQQEKEQREAAATAPGNHTSFVQHFDPDSVLKRQRSPLRSIEANRDGGKSTEWLSYKSGTEVSKRASMMAVPDIDNEKAGWPTDDDEVEDLGAW